MNATHFGDFQWLTMVGNENGLFLRLFDCFLMILTPSTLCSSSGQCMLQESWRFGPIWNHFVAILLPFSMNERLNAKQDHEMAN